MGWDLKIVLICVSLVVNQRNLIENAYWPFVSSFENSRSSSLAHLLMGRFEVLWSLFFCTSSFAPLSGVEWAFFSLSFWSLSKELTSE